jgi:hypothetical protein
MNNGHVAGRLDDLNAAKRVQRPRRAGEEARDVRIDVRLDVFRSFRDRPRLIGNLPVGGIDNQCGPGADVAGTRLDGCRQQRFNAHDFSNDCDFVRGSVKISPPSQGPERRTQSLRRIFVGIVFARRFRTTLSHDA